MVQLCEAYSIRGFVSNDVLAQVKASPLRSSTRHRFPAHAALAEESLIAGVWKCLRQKSIEVLSEVFIPTRFCVALFDRGVQLLRSPLTRRVRKSI